MTDYAFVPGDIDDFRKGWRSLLDGENFQGRPNTVLLGTSGSLRNFIFMELAQSPMRVPPPIGNLIVVSHANSHGILQIPSGVSLQSAQFLTYEDLREAVQLHQLEIPEGLLGRDVGGKLIPTTVHVRGCQVGAEENRPFFKKLQEAFGPHVHITAPKHMDAIQQRVDRNGKPIAWIEFMLYAFAAYSVSPLPSRTAIIDAFDKAGHKLINNSAVTKGLWESWVPKKIPKQEKPLWTDVPVRLWPGWVSGNADLFREVQQFAFSEDKLGSPFPIAISGGNPKGSEQVRRDFIKANATAISNKAEFKSDWPLNKRFGFDSLEAMINGFDWVSAGPGLWTGRRFEYLIWTPIVDLNNGILPAIFYRANQPADDSLMPLSDTAFFARLDAIQP